MSSDNEQQKESTPQLQAPPELYLELHERRENGPKFGIDWQRVKEAVRQDPSIASYLDEEHGRAMLLNIICALKPPLDAVEVVLAANPSAALHQTTALPVCLYCLQSSWTPLMEACACDASPEVVRRLITAGGPKSLYVVDDYGNAAIHIICLHGPGNATENFRQLLLADPELANLHVKGYGKASIDDRLLMAPEGYESFTNQDMVDRLTYTLLARHYKTIESENVVFLHAALATKARKDVVEFAFDRDGAVQAGSRDIYSNLPLHYAICASPDQYPGMVAKLVHAYPNSASMPDPSSGRLPLHIALENGFTWSNGIEQLYLNHKIVLKMKERDRESKAHGLYPFATAAAFSDLETTFCLLRANPDFLEQANPELLQPTKSHAKKRHKKDSKILPQSSRLLLLALLCCLGFVGAVNATTSASSTIHQTNTILPDITGAIGNTPLVDLSRITRRYGVEGRILGKCEYLSPGFSKKDRIARQIVMDALESGELRPNQPVVELTSGNTGTGLAIVCGVLGVPFCAVMSKGNSVERARMMKALGAQVVLVDQAAGSTPGQVSGEDLELVEQKAQELVESMSAFRADQFIRESNLKAHLLGTGPEIWNQSGGSVTADCDFVGTGGSFGGCAAFLRPKGVRCYVIEPSDAAILAGQHVRNPNHRIQGGGYIRGNEELPMLTSSHDDSFVDGYINVSDEEAIQAARDLAQYEGIFCGFSGGANFAAAIKLLKSKEKGGTIAILLCDSGLKYLSTDLWE